jgi:hypothetical protein
MDIINNKLSKDIYGIIKKYIDYSPINMEKIIQDNQYRNNDDYITIRDDINLIDVFITLFRRGHTGFMFSGVYKKLKEDIDKKIKKENLQITYEKGNYDDCYNFDNKDNLDYYYDLLLLPQFLRVVSVNCDV